MSAARGYSALSQVPSIGIEPASSMLESTGIKAQGIGSDVSSYGSVPPWSRRFGRTNVSKRCRHYAPAWMSNMPNWRREKEGCIGCIPEPKIKVAKVVDSTCRLILMTHQNKLARCDPKMQGAEFIWLHHWPGQNWQCILPYPAYIVFAGCLFRFVLDESTQAGNIKQ